MRESPTPKPAHDLLASAAFGVAQRTLSSDGARAWVPPVVALLALAATLAIALFVTAMRRAHRRRVAQQRMGRALVGERRAAELLERAGYSITGAQVPTRYALQVDGASEVFEVRADYLVEKDGRSWVAEVKTGAFAPRLETAATRRQLIEYAVAFRATGVLLVDVEAKRIRVVELPLLLPAATAGGRWSNDVFAHAPQTDGMRSRLALLFVGCLAFGTVVSLLR